MIKSFKLFENTEAKFEIGDYVSCKGRQQSIHFNGECGIVFSKRSEDSSFIDVKFPIKFNNWLHGGNHTLIDPDVCVYGLESKLLEHISKEEYEEYWEELIKKRDELRDRMRDIDPYGEENWMEN